MAPYSQAIRCDVCKAQLSITATREDVPRTSTELTVSCPVCNKQATVVVPLSLDARSVQVAWFERPEANPPPQMRHA